MHLESLLFKTGRGQGRATCIGTCGLCVCPSMPHHTGGYATLIIVPISAHLNLSCSKRGGAKCHKHRHVMWAVCDVSVVQPHLYFGLFGLGVCKSYNCPYVCTLEPLLSKRGGAMGVPLA